MPSWWVNHKQTHRAEIEGGYLWSPKTRRDGARSVFYENMRRAEPGDPVISYAFAEVGFIGRVEDYAFPAPKPSEFAETGDRWLDDGWLVPVAWRTVRRPVRPKEHIEELRPLLPAQYSPIQPETGNGNQGAYLAEVSPALINAVERLSGYDPGSSLLIPPMTRETIDDEVQAALDLELEETERVEVVKARRGQGRFREAVLAVEPRCRLTGLDDPRFLRASHIKPWRNCDNTTERLDAKNGLMLAPHADFLFDAGYISFADDGEVFVSPALDREVLERLGLGDLRGRSVGAFDKRQREYLDYHRNSVFIPA